MNDNASLIRGVYEAFAKGDIPAVLGVLAPDVHWSEAQGGPYGGVFVGPEAVLANVFMNLGGDWEDFSAVPAEFIQEGETIVALGEYGGTCRATGKQLQAPFAHVWKLRGGRAVSFFQYTDTALHLSAME